MSELNTKSYFSNTSDDDPFASIVKGEPLPPPPELTPAPVEKPAAVLEVTSADTLANSVPLDRNSVYRSKTHSRNASSSSIGAMGIQPSSDAFLQGSHSLTPSPSLGLKQFVPGAPVDPLRQSPSVPNLGFGSQEGFRKTHSRHSSLTGGSFAPPPGGHVRNASLGSIVASDVIPMQPPSPAMGPPPSMNHNVSGQTRRGRPSYVVPPSLVPEQRVQGAPSPIYTPSPAESPSQGNPVLNIDSSVQGHVNQSPYMMQPSGLGFYQPLQHHWFYKREVQGKGTWIPFSNKDSYRIEETYLQGVNQQAVVDIAPVHGGRYDVHISKRLCYPVYWDEEPLAVRRCGWFYKPTLESKFYPYDEMLSACLEEEYRVSCVTNQWHRQVDLQNGETVSFHNHTTFFQFPSRSAGVYAPPMSGDFANMPSPDYQANSIQPLILKRSASECHSIPDDESDEVDHLVFLVHGIGSVCDLRFRPVVEVVDSFREISNNLLSSHFGNSVRSGAAHRVEFLPVNWHETLHGDDTGIDRRLKPITLASIPKLRHFANDTVLDVLFYTSPVYCETIVSTVVHELNRMYELFKQRNPGFTGKVSLGGHSLGTLILFDILSHQPSPKSNADMKQEKVIPSETDALPPEDDQLDDPSIEEICKKLNMDDLLPVFQKEKLDFKTLLLCGDTEFKEMGLTIGQRVQLKIYLRDVHRRRLKTKGAASHEVHTSSVGYNLTSEGTGQPSIEYPRIEFEPANFFAMGSPIAMFVAVRGIDTLGADFKLPTCRKMFNIFHPYDPIAYRIESLIDPRLASLPPVLIPHHKGRKRMHLELRETVTKITGDIKQKLWDGLKNTWTAVQTYTNISRIPAIGPLVGGSEASRSNENLLQISSETMPSPTVAAGAAVVDGTTEGFAEFRGSDDPGIHQVPVGSLNGGRRIDYVLQEAPFESVNEYIFAMASHVGYWQSEDTILMILREIYADMGLQEDQPLPASAPQVAYQPVIPPIETQPTSPSYQPYYYNHNTACPPSAPSSTQTALIPPVASLPLQQQVASPPEPVPLIPMGSPIPPSASVASQRSRRYVSVLQPQAPTLQSPSNGLERTVPAPPVSGFVPLR